MRRRRFLASPLAVLATAAIAADDYPEVAPGRPLQFPRDFGAHPALRNEWWYLTALTQATDGSDFGLQITFFRNRPGVAGANPSRFAPRQLLFAHAAIADPRYGRLRHDQRAAREGFDLAGVAADTTDVFIGDWSLKLVDEIYLARIAAQSFQLDLRIRSTQPILVEGDAGFSRKGPQPGQASYYYSQPHLAVSGNVAIGERTLDVRGTAWLDHEWSSELMAATATGWDWVGINLDDGGALMAFRMRQGSGAALWAGGTLRTSDGSVRVFRPDGVRFTERRRWRSPRTAVEYPVAMVVGAGDAEYVLEPLMDDQELDSRESTGTIYWEGAVWALQAGRRVGRGYLELTGYWKPLKF